VDEAGKVHYGDTVPDKYKSVAKAVALRDAQVSEQDLRAAQERANREKGKVMELRSAREAAALTPPPVAVIQPSAPDAPKTDSCYAQWQVYLDSAACFAPFQNRRGGMKPGFEICGPSVQEPQHCGGPPPDKLMQ
jgi:hypothetical protein